MKLLDSLVLLSLYFLPLAASALAQTTPSTDNLQSSSITIQGGFSIPVGEFSASTHGAASPGLTSSGEFKAPIGNSTYWLLSSSISINSMNGNAISNAFGLPSSVSVTAGNWISIAPLVGLGVIIRAVEALELHVSGKAGILIGRAPELTLTYQGVPDTRSAFTAVSFAYGFSISLLTTSNFVITSQFQTGRPRYSIFRSGSAGFQGTYEQSMSLFQVIFGVSL